MEEQGFSKDKCFDQSDDYTICPSTIYLLVFNKTANKFIGIGRLLFLENSTARLVLFYKK